jgi:hypothetical protein
MPNIAFPTSLALRALLERDGVPIAEQIRRGVDLWLEKKKK